MPSRILCRKIKLNYKLPTNYNNGKPIPKKIITNVKRFFINKYEGLSIEGPSEGYGKQKGLIFEDRNLEFSILINKRDFKKVKREIPILIEKFKKDFDQISILCYFFEVMST